MVLVLIISVDKKTLSRCKTGIPMSAEGPGGLPPRPPLKRSLSKASPARNDPETGSSRDGRTVTGAEAKPGQPKKKRKFSIQPLTLDNLEPVTETPSRLMVSPRRRQSSPGILYSPVKTPVKDEIKIMWQNLELRRPSVQKCPDDVPRAFRFVADEVPVETVVMTGKGELTPYNRITLDGVSLGIAARGPRNSEQAEVLFNTVLQEKCGAIVNLTTVLEGMVDGYLPDPGQSSTFGQVTVEREVNGAESSAASRSPFSLSPIRAHVRVKSNDKEQELLFHWERGMLNHVSAAPEILVKVSESMPEGPVLVHCQKGIGRTAMVMLVHAMRLKKLQGLTRELATPTLIKMIEDGRRCRGEFLENERQLQSVLKAVALMYGISDEELLAAVKTVPVR